MNSPGRAKEILKARAKTLARADRQESSGPVLEVVEFGLAKERYGIEHRFVREVVAFQEFAPLPCVPPFFAGVMNLRGQVLPLLDIKKFFDLPETGITDLHSVVVVHVDDIELGILVDAVAGLATVPVDAIQPSLHTLVGIREKYLKGVTSDHMVILDAARMLSDPKIVVNEEI